MDNQDEQRHSKFLSLVLRHRPELLGLEPDAGGWVATGLLLQAMQEHGHPLGPEDLARIVTNSPKQRFAFNEDGSRIRASQGHSIDVDLGLEPLQPPDLLYHGTVAIAIPAILREGLKRQQRHHVHLSADIATARQVGARRGKPVILQVGARRMHDAGMAFFRSENGVWLTAGVPPEYLSLRDDS